MDPRFGLALLACSGPGAAVSQARNFTEPLAHAVVVGILACLAFRRWRDGVGPLFVPVVCGALFALHPAWTVIGGGGDGGSAKMAASLLATLVAWACAVAPGLMRRASHRSAEAPGVGPNDPPDARSFEEQAPDLPETSIRPHGEASPRKAAPDGAFGRWLDAIVSRAFAAMAVGLFVYVQYLLFQPRPRFPYSHDGWALHPVYYLVGIERDDDWGNWALGPVFFLRGASPADDWIGYALLAVAVPALLSVVVWPNRWTALVASLTAWAWLIPATARAIVGW